MSTTQQRVIGSDPWSGRFADENRLDVWRAHGATPEEAVELMAYAAGPALVHSPATRVYPLADAPCVSAWQRYVAEAAQQGAFSVLRRVFVQLRFPVRSGMSQDEAYRAATRRGILPDDDAPGLILACPEGLRLFLHPTPAGRVPVVRADAREDFDALVRAVTRRNEPEPIPASMGACMIAGYNNWDRVGALRHAYLVQHPQDWTGEGWAAAFRDMLPQAELYQDRFMLLSSGPYSSTPAHALGLLESDWKAASVPLRLEHECTHFFTRQAFGSMRKSLLDELVADYMGLVAALGEFQPKHFLQFMGLEDFPRYREGGRLQNYRGAPPLSDGAFRVLPSVVESAARNLGRLDPLRARRPFEAADKAQVITALMRVGLEGLASGEAGALLAAAL